MNLQDDEAVEEYDDLTANSSSSTATRYKGSAFASVLVIILFVIWFLNRVGCLGRR